MNKKLDINNQDNSVESELNELFNQIPFWERVKLQMVAFQYRKETPLFKMLFDKKFRKDRYRIQRCPVPPESSPSEFGRISVIEKIFIKFFLNMPLN